MQIDKAMKSSHQKIEKLVELFADWSNPESGLASDAIQKTVENKLFPKEDVDFAINHYRNSIRVDELSAWVQSADLTRHISVLQSKKMICLLAGNLPMVGFQDVIVGLLSGVQLNVKISRKDPFLIASFLEYVNQSNFFDSICFSTDLSELSQIQADFVFFSGSDSSVPEVKRALKTQGCVNKSTKYLIRTAHFSVCILEENMTDYDLTNLAESIWRYNGKGCRSVAVVFTKGKPEKLLYKLKNLIHEKDFSIPSYPYNSSLAVRHSLNVATNRSSFLFNNKVIEIGTPEPHLENVVFVSSYNPLNFENFLSLHKEAIQSVYSIAESEGTENLKFAQMPPISWQPDGVDPLRWMLDIISYPLNPVKQR